MEATKGIVAILNTPDETSRYIVSRLVEGNLWYWGSWDDPKEAIRVAKTFENGMVIEKC